MWKRHVFDQWFTWRRKAGNWRLMIADVIQVFSLLIWLIFLSHLSVGSSVMEINILYFLKSTFSCLWRFISNKVTTLYFFITPQRFSLLLSASSSFREIPRQRHRQVHIVVYTGWLRRKKGGEQAVREPDGLVVGLVGREGIEDKVVGKGWWKKKMRSGKTRRAVRCKREGRRSLWVYITEWVDRRKDSWEAP